MNGYRISEVAERSGFSPATLRYYEDIGLVPPPARSPAGYRVYDERALGRLTFVARAKQLGLSLEEVGDLTELWDSDECAPVQRRMADFVAGTLVETRRQVTELTARAGRLEAAAARLAQEPHVGPCAASCACNAPPGETPDQLTSGVKTGFRDAPIACTLAPAELPGRLADWKALAERVVGQEPLDGGVRLRFPPEPGLAVELAGLAQAEQACCAFFHFAVGIRAGAVTLEVRGPVESQPVFAELFGSASGSARGAPGD